MIAPLIVIAAHLLDVWTLQLAVERYGMWGEANLFAHLVVGSSGLLGLGLLKICGGMAAGAIVLWLRRGSASWRRMPPQLPLVLAGGLGIVGAAVNTATLLI